MFSYFFDTPAEPDPIKELPKAKFKKSEPDTASDEEKYKIDPGYYFKHLDPKQIENVITNFNQELQTGQKKFKDTLMIKYQNVLQCEKEFQNMCQSSEMVINNCQSIQESLANINQNYTKRVMDIVNQQTTLTESSIEHEVEETLQSLLNEHQSCEDLGQRQYLESLIIQRHFIDKIQQITKSLSDEESTSLNHKINQLVIDTSLILNHFIATPRKVLIPLKRLTRGTISPNICSVIYDGILKYMLNQSCNFQVMEQQISFTRILKMIEINKVVGEQMSVMIDDQLGLEKIQKEFIMKIQEQFETIVKHSSAQNQGQRLVGQFVEVNNNINIILNLQLQDTVDEHIKRLQIQFLTQIFQVHYFDQIEHLILNVVPQIITEEIEKVKQQQTEMGIITDVREDVQNRVFNYKSRQIRSSQMPYLIRVLQKIAHVDLHMAMNHLTQQLDKIRGHNTLFLQLSEKMQQMENQMVEQIKLQILRNDNQDHTNVDDNLKADLAKDNTKNFVKLVQLCMIIKISETKEISTDMLTLINNDLFNMYETNFKSKKFINIRLVYQIYKVDIVNFLKSFGVKFENSNAIFIDHMEQIVKHHSSGIHQMIINEQIQQFKIKIERMNQ